MLRYVNKRTVLTLLTVMGGYLLASSLHFSGPLSMVVAGLIVGNDTVRGGLRGGISIALALTKDMDRDLFLMITYVVVVFSIIIQGLTVGTLVKRVTGIEPSTEDVNGHH